MTTTLDRTPEQILELLILAAGNGDVVRLAALVNDSVTAETPSFTRAGLQDAWSARWTHHLTGPASLRPPGRVNRSLPNLIGATVVSGMDGEDMTVQTPAMLSFLAERIHLAEAQDRTRPANLNLPVGDSTRAAAAALVAAATDPPVDPESNEPVPAVPVATPAP